MGYEGKKLTVTARGEGGRTECLAAITNDKEIKFGAFKVTAIDDRGSLVSKRTKFIVFFYRATGAGAMAKAKAGRHLGLIETAFNGHHVLFQIDELWELSEAEIVRKLRASGGAHAPTGFDFGHGDVGEGSEEKPPEKSDVANPADAAAPNAGFAGAKVNVSTAKTDPVSAVTSGMGQVMLNPAGAAADESNRTTHSQSISAAAMRETVLPNNTGGVSTTGRSVVMLVTSMPSTTIIEGNQASLRNIFKGKLKVATSEIDGVLPENKEVRSTLFSCSEKRGVYPQVFIKESDGKYTFVGDFEEIQSLTDTDSLDPQILAQHPEIATFSSTFKEFM